MQFLWTECVRQLDDVMEGLQVRMFKLSCNKLRVTTLVDIQVKETIVRWLKMTDPYTQIDQDSGQT